MPSGDRADRVRGAFIGLAIGDAAGWPAVRHRSLVMAPWSRRLRRELDVFAEEHQVTTLPVPFALNLPVEPLAVGPSDDAEWLAWTALRLAEARDGAAPGREADDGGSPAPYRMPGIGGERWLAGYRDLAGRDDLRVRISVRNALDNLGRGVEPPASGHDNPHFFDDAAAVRAVAFGAGHTDPVAAARADAVITNAEDGVHGAAAIAAAVALLAGGATVGEAVDAAVAELPEGGVIRHAVLTALDAARAAGGAFAAVPALDAALDDHVYSYGVSAAQTVAVALALTDASRGRLAEAVPAAACLPAFADSAPALTGALTGAATGYAALPEGWRETARPLLGCGLPDLAGADLLAIADRLIGGERSC
ncbi:ADP-ribosylglycohydrolase family protein [Bailinhaonella thermotolerans]|uniref:ADP-ribosylglycohydrolase n=1 Tax=Bailinhaonella thermotolerans TaxID=1070861 RepID=A0A3A4A9H8_9ACTN|nr:ADP-ribosylglycohydrolase family protein [Bailinhaonella thermotolerans]RJL22964.1 hypothetical protein D5H75_33800 [Bailinhaonella thermotolerans]